jgi:hypothetical protein
VLNGVRVVKPEDITLQRLKKRAVVGMVLMTRSAFEGAAGLCWMRAEILSRACLNQDSDEYELMCRWHDDINHNTYESPIEITTVGQIDRYSSDEDAREGDWCLVGTEAQIARLLQD